MLAPHIVTMNFSAQKAGVTKHAYMAALRVEGVPVYSYLHQPLHKLPRLALDTAAPRGMWTENLRHHGVDYRGLEPPGAHARVTSAIELKPTAMTSLAAPEADRWQPPLR